MAPRPDAERLAVWRAFLEVHRSVVQRLEEELARERDLPLDWYDVLVQLHEAGGTRRMQELAGALLLEKSSLTRRVDRMVAAGLVERRPAPDDGRGTLAVLTPQGRAVLRRAAPVHLRGVHRHFTGHLDDDDVAVLTRVLATVAAGLDAPQR